MGDNRYSIFPIKHENLWEAYKNHQRSFWTAEELDFTPDLKDLGKLNKDELHYILHVLAFFSQSDGIVNENLAMRFYSDVDIAEAKAFFSMQMLIETIHSEVYGLLIDTYVETEVEKDRLFNAIENIPTIAKKSKWALKWIESQKSFAHRLFAFAVVEGVFFSGSFCAIFWFRKRGLLMSGLGTANEWISRDEGLHWEFASLLYKELGLTLPVEDAYQIMREAVEIEREFISDALPVSMIGMNQDLMAQYIECVADRVLNKFGFKSIFNKENPFEFMKLMDLENKTNFFEKRVTEYARPTERTISFDADF